MEIALIKFFQLSVSLSLKAITTATLEYFKPLTLILPKRTSAMADLLGVYRENAYSSVLRSFRVDLLRVALISLAVNLLMLTGPLFILQIFDRVLPSRSVPTLVTLFGLVAVLYIFLGLFKLLRSKALSRMSTRIDADLMDVANKVSILAGLNSTQKTIMPIADLTIIRKFFSSAGASSLFDLPWVPVYLTVVFLLHVWLGLLATAAVVIVIVLAVINEVATKRSISDASLWEFVNADFSETSRRNAETIAAMGMTSDVTKHWRAMRYRALLAGEKINNQMESILAGTTTLRFLLQAAVLTLGAYLVIGMEITTGAMIASSILANMALAPVNIAIGTWRYFVRARQANNRLEQSLLSFAGNVSETLLPEPKGNLRVSNAHKLRPNSQYGGSTPLLKEISFDLSAGDGLGVIGPSGAGKTSLAKLIIGLWIPEAGEVVLDGTTLEQWDREKLGKHIGYLPQSVGLLPGTIRQNIARFDNDASAAEVVEAAQIAGVHDLILQLPNGYDTEIGTGKFVISGGYAQRIALARAVFRFPPLVVLDEPNSNLDAEGDQALTTAIDTLRKRGSTVVVMAHRPSAIASVNKVLMLRDGVQVEFGTKDEVLRKVTRTTSGSAKRWVS